MKKQLTIPPCLRDYGVRYEDDNEDLYINNKNNF